MELNKIYQGDALSILTTFPDKSINSCITSPPYYALRNYNCDGQIGLEESPELYIETLVNLFKEVKRVLRDDGTLWLNLGDSYAGGGGASGHTSETKNLGLKPKDLIGIPWMVAFALRADGWFLRQDIIWNKPNPMPESVTDRCTRSHEYIFLLSKSKRYYFDNESIKEPCVTKDNVVRDRDKTRLNNTPGKTRSGGLTTNNYTKRNKRDVWTITTKPFRGAHFAVFPEALIQPCILAGCPNGGIVLDPFIGAGTTGVVANKLNRNYIGIDLNPNYIEIANKRIYESNMV